ncbi:unnamed protein product [Gulo gulo]|uniref:Cystatin-9-like n=1 Tax=Gulo gulo TaxID=48420 RepID=A0A9X9MDS7_GULGU|nr:unnamed protein product [Gulo gulo]
MLHLLFRWALPRAMFLLLLGSQLLVTPGSRSEEEAENKHQNAMRSYFLGTVEYALHIFNLQSNDTRAYRLVRILNSRRELSLEKNTMAFSMELQLRRTKCEKFDDDIDNCPFQESSGQNNVRCAVGPSGHTTEDAAWGRGESRADNRAILRDIENRNAGTAIPTTGVAVGAQLDSPSLGSPCSPPGQSGNHLCPLTHFIC